VDAGDIKMPEAADSAAPYQVFVKNENPQVGSQSITIDELQRLWKAKEPVTILDVRTDRSLEGDGTQAKGAVRMPPDHVIERAGELGLKPEGWLIAYCA
jgi:hypothetical protein